MPAAKNDQGDEGRQDEAFLSRWSRRKQEARADEANPPVPPVPSAGAGDEPPPLPPIEELTADSDVSGFLHPKVSEDTRRAAFRKLFSDPRFNVMDGLDVYIDDYSQPDPLPAGMLEKLAHWQTVLAASAREAEKETRERPLPSPGQTSAPSPAGDTATPAQGGPREDAAAPSPASADPGKRDA
jgi:hypothetical protein